MNRGERELANGDLENAGETPALPGPWSASKPDGNRKHTGE